MSINVTQNTGTPFPIRVLIHGHVDEKFTLAAAIELREKLDKAITEFQDEEAQRHNAE